MAFAIHNVEDKGHNYLVYPKTLLPHPGSATEINIIIPSNWSPRIGTLCSLGLAFVVARRMKNLGLDVRVTCDMWDREKGEQRTIGRLIYQNSLCNTGRFQEYLPDYQTLLKDLSERYGVQYKVRLEAEFLAQDGIPQVLQKIIMNREFLAKYLAPSTGSLAVRASCPECGLVDKYGVKNTYSPGVVRMLAPWPILLQHRTRRTTFPLQLPTLNLILGLFYENTSYN
ncbi:hypothetical protein QQZ08_006759 [Neonectria magnoliae]|uniref:Uncharacterized protein n=1 Tax=Neonectria magnoliae TaxID=2732573 RepID=A0ABR1I1A9_9HYPO